MASAERSTHVIIVTLPAYGHTRPMLAMAAYLAGPCGLRVTFVGGWDFEAAVTAMPGVEFEGLFTRDEEQKFFAEIGAAIMRGDAAEVQQEMTFVQPIPREHETLQRVVRQHHAEARVVVLCDIYCWGALPMLMGALGCERVAAIAVNSGVVTLSSSEIAPFPYGQGLQPPDRLAELYAEAEAKFADMHHSLTRILDSFGCTRPLPSKLPFDCAARVFDRILHMTPPSLEWPRSDLPDNFAYVGFVPGNPSVRELPEWFQEFIVDDTTGHPLVLVTSGTVPMLSGDELLLPTMEACRDLPVRLVVCQVDAVMPADVVVPANARCVRWISFEQIIPYLSLAVTNAGFGGVCQFLGGGVPMVAAGQRQDKAETSARVAMTGAGINLKTQTPTVAQLRGAITTILADPSYKQNAERLHRDFLSYNALDNIYREVQNVTISS